MDSTHIVIRIANKAAEKFAKYNEENDGPCWWPDNDIRYFADKEWFWPFYTEPLLNETTLMTVVSVAHEVRAENFIFDAVEALGIQLKCLVFHQDGDGRATGSTEWLYGRKHMANETESGTVWKDIRKDGDQTMFFVPHETMEPKFDIVYDPAAHGELKY